MRSVAPPIRTIAVTSSRAVAPDGARKSGSTRRSRGSLASASDDANRQTVAAPQANQRNIMSIEPLRLSVGLYERITKRLHAMIRRPESWLAILLRRDRAEWLREGYPRCPDVARESSRSRVL